MNLCFAWRLMFQKIQVMISPTLCLDSPHSFTPVSSMWTGMIRITFLTYWTWGGDAISTGNVQYDLDLIGSAKKMKDLFLVKIEK